MTSTVQPVVTYVLSFDIADLDSAAAAARPPAYIHSYTTIIVLSLLLILSVLLNLLLAITIATNKYLRNHSFYVVQLSLTLSCLLDSVFNGTVSIVYMCETTWEMGVTLCYTNAFVVTGTVTMISFLTVQALVDRYVYFQHPKVYRVHCTFSKQFKLVFILISCTAFLGLPFLLLCDARPFPARMACGPVLTKESCAACAAVLVILVICSLGIPIVFIVVVGVLLAGFLAHYHHERGDSLVGDALHSGGTKDKDTRLRLTRVEVKSLVQVAVICGYYSLCNVPYTVFGVLHPLSSRNRIDEDSFRDVCWTPLGDVITAWLRYLIPCVHPVSLLLSCDDIRQEMEILIKSLLFGDFLADSEPNVPNFALVNSWKKLSSSLWSRQTDRSTTSIALNRFIPVLFPTENGLHLRIPSRYSSDYDYHFCDNYDICCDGGDK